MMEKDYKDTLFLPQTSFPMRAGLARKEPEMIAFWESHDLWKRLRAKSKGRKPFILHDGPPYANGHLHLGHALNKILKDVINRAWQMRGFDANYVPGWDCHGLPIEWKVEEHFRAEGKDKDDIPVIEFRQYCREFAEKWIEIQREEFIRLGVAGDWENPYLTMNYKAEAKIVSEIGRFLLDNSLYRGAKPVMWSVVEKTTLAEAEIEYKDHHSTTIWVGFDILGAQSSLLEGAAIVIWTTTPWTIPANRAIAYHEELAYVVVTLEEGEFQRKKYIVAEALLEDFAKRLQITAIKILGKVKGKDFPKDLACAHPLRGQGYEEDIIVRAAPFVTSEQGTGFVHIAPGHGYDDYTFGLKHGLAAGETVDAEGVFYDTMPLFAGLAVYRHSDGKEGDANAAIIAALQKTGQLLARAKITHNYPHSWRSKAPLIFRNTAQWFIAMDRNALRKKALQAIDETKFFPSEGHDRIQSMIATRPDWCVSRQRCWGVPLPIFVHRKTGEALRDQKVIDRIVGFFEKEGADAWFKRDIQDFLGTEYSAEDYTQVRDVVDVWFDSGSTHAFVLEEREDLSWPASLYLEGTDQHRGWFHSSLLQSCGTRDRAPFEAVLTHGFLLDEKGHKMSKSVGNIITPKQIIDKYGADILRIWVISSNYSDDLRVGHNILAQNVDMYRRVRNTLRWLLGNLNNQKTSLPQEMPSLEKYMLHRLARLAGELEHAIENFDMTSYLHKLHLFCTQELSAFYFDIRKDSLYCDAVDNASRRASLYVLEKIFLHLVRWFAPIIPFTAEEAWQAYPHADQGTEESIHLQDFMPVPETWYDEGLEEEWQTALAVRRAALSALEIARKAGKIGSSLEASLEIYVTSAQYASLSKINMEELTLTSSVMVSPEASGHEASGHEASGHEASGHDATTIEGVQEIAVKVRLASGKKCQRCWKFEELTNDSQLCQRCAALCG